MRPVVLMVLDGWGYRPDKAGNAVLAAHTPNFNRLWKQYPHTLVNTTGLAVGLPDSVMGNSEVGHMNIGAGRVVYQDLTRINESIRDGSFYKNPVLLGACAAAKKSGGRLHLMGLFSDGGVHSHIAHLQALLELTKRQGMLDVAIHCFTDGRDTSPTGGAKYLEQFLKQLQVQPMGGVGVERQDAPPDFSVPELCLGARIATVMGRYYAMDRDKRWERTQKAYDAMVMGEGRTATSAKAAIAEAYAAGETDEFIVPTVIVENGKPVATINDDDVVLFYNYRGDRARQITRALTDPDFDQPHSGVEGGAHTALPGGGALPAPVITGFKRQKFPKLVEFACMAEYDQTFKLPAAYPSQTLDNNFGEWVSKHQRTQLRIAETEKYAHVTFFFNGGEETPYPGEDRVMIQSPKDVPTYDHKPEMSARGVTEAVLDRIASQQYDAIILNYANPDMVGHTGCIPAAVKAVETVDDCLGKVADAVLAQGGGLVITADHGNCEQMQNADGSPHTSHTTNLVPLIVVAPDAPSIQLRDGGKLSDLAPTLLEMMRLPQPPEMSGCSLIIK